MTVTNDEEDKLSGMPDTDTEESSPNESELSENELLQKKIDENHDLLLRAKAEVENIKKRSQKEVENAYKYSTESILQEIIPIYDSLSLSCSLSDCKSIFNNICSIASAPIAALKESSPYSSWYSMYWSSEIILRTAISVLLSIPIIFAE